MTATAPPPRLPYAKAAVFGALTLLRPADWPSGVRLVYLWLPGSFAAWGALSAAWRERRGSADRVGGSDRGLGGALAVAAGTASLFAAAQLGTLKLDAAVEHTLLRRGVPRPRIWMAVGVVGARLALAAAARAIIAARNTQGAADGSGSGTGQEPQAPGRH